VGKASAMIEPHELRELRARLGVPHLEQMTHRSGQGTALAFYWGCGCSAMGKACEPEDLTPMRWSRCDHHAAAESEAATT
jgi:hypothetical protein